MRAADFAAFVKGAKRRADGVWWDARCPAHEDHHASLSFRDGDRGVLMLTDRHEAAAGGLDRYLSV